METTSNVVSIRPAPVGTPDDLIAQTALRDAFQPGSTVEVVETTTTRTLRVVPPVVPLVVVPQVDPKVRYLDSQLLYPDDLPVVTWSEWFANCWPQLVLGLVSSGLAVGLLWMLGVAVVAVGAWFSANAATILELVVGVPVTVMVILFLLSLLSGGKVKCPGLHCGGCGG